MEASTPVPAEHREWVAKLRYGGTTPLVSLDCLHVASNCWACPPCHSFSVRGPDYLHTKSKIPASDYLLHPLAFHVLEGSSPISHIMNHPHSSVRAAVDAAVLADLPQQPFVWVFNFQLGRAKAHRSLVHYFVTFTSPTPGSLTQKFLDGDDAFRNARLKLLMRFPEAPRVVQTLLGNSIMSACIIDRYTKCSYMRGKHYMEVDVAPSMLTRTVMNLTSGVLRHVVSELAFVLEGMHPNELPERILGAMRLVKLDLSLGVHIDRSEEVLDDMANHVSVTPESISSSSGKGKLGNKNSKEVTYETAAL